MKKNITILVIIISIISSCGDKHRHNDIQYPPNQIEGQKSPESKPDPPPPPPVKITYEQALEFMQNRCSQTGQSLLETKTVYFEGTKLYMFLSNKLNIFCISAISEIRLEILKTDCGSGEVKINQWNYLH
jgi:hypothetical protein